MLDPSQNLTERLPYWDISDGVMFLHGGKMIEVALELHAPAAVFLDTKRLEDLWKALKNVLRMTPPHSRTRIIVESSPMGPARIDAYVARKGNASGIVSDMVDAKARMMHDRRRRGELYDQRLFLCIALPAPPQRRGASLSPEEYAGLVERAADVRRQVRERLERLGYAPRELDDQQIFELCWRYFNPELASSTPPRYRPIPGRTYFAERTLRDHPDIDTQTTRRQILSSVITNKANNYIKVGAKYGRCITLKAMPDETSVNQLAKVISGMGARHYYIVVDYYHEPLGPTMRKLGTRLQGFKGAMQGAKDGKYDTDVSTDVAAGKLTRLLAHLSETSEHVFSTGCTMIFFDDSADELASTREIAVSAISTLGSVMPIIANYQNVPLYVEQCAPMNGAQMDFKFKTVETTCGDFFPLAGPWHGGDPMTIFTSRVGTLTTVNLFDPDCTNWNGFIVGGSGAGKTFMAQTLLRDAIAEGVEAFIIDRGYGYAPMMEAIGAPIVPMEPGSNVIINPFDLDEGEVTPDDEQLQFVMSMIRVMIDLADDNVLRATEEMILMDAVKQTYQQALVPEYDDLTGDERWVFKGTRMSNLVRRLNTIEEVGGRSLQVSEKQIGKNLALRLTKWTGNNPEGRLVDGETSISIDAPVMYFETSGLIANPDIGRVTLLLLSHLIFRRFGKNPFARKMVFFDEAWALLDNPEAKRLIVELYRRARRYNCAVYGVSQGITDFMDIPNLIDQANYWFIGFNAGNDDNMRRLRGMNEAALSQYHSIGRSRGKYSEFLTWIHRGNDIQGDIVRLESSRLEYWLFTTSAHDMEVRSSVAIDQHGGDISAAARTLAARGQ